MVATVAAEALGLVVVLVLVGRSAPAGAPELRLTARDLGGSGLVVACETKTFLVPLRYGSLSE